LFNVGDVVRRKPDEYSTWWVEQCKWSRLELDDEVPISRINDEHCNIKELASSADSTWHTSWKYFDLVVDDDDTELGDWV
jgi:hypothetical protein